MCDTEGTEACNCKTYCTVLNTYNLTSKIQIYCISDRERDRRGSAVLLCVVPLRSDSIATTLQAAIGTQQELNALLGWYLVAW